MKKDKRFSLRLRTYYLLIIAIVVIISFGAVVGALTALQQLGVIGHINVSTLVALLLVAAAASGSASFLVGRRVLAPMVKLSKASREVARGNYSITVEDPSKLEEVQTTLRNFNALVREMNRINNVTNDFVSSVSHEFKTPLTAIEGYAMLLQDTGLTQAERDEYLDKILYNTHRLSTLVGNILMLSKLENQSLSDRQRHQIQRAGAGAVPAPARPDGMRRRLRHGPRLRHAARGAGAHFREILSGRQLPQGHGKRPRPAARQAHRRAVRRRHRGRQRPRAGLDVPRHPAEEVKQTLQVFIAAASQRVEKLFSTRWKTAKKFGRQATRTRRRTKVR